MIGSDQTVDKTLSNVSKPKHHRDNNIQLIYPNSYISQPTCISLISQWLVNREFIKPLANLLQVNHGSLYVPVSYLRFLLGSLCIEDTYMITIIFL